jgi:hypothetical protein
MTQHQHFGVALDALTTVFNGRDVWIDAPVEQFGEAVEARVNALLEAASGGELQVLEMTLTMTVPPGVIEDFNRELEAAARRS